MYDLLDRIPCDTGHVDRENRSLTLPGLNGGADHAAELVLERAGAHQEAGMLHSIFPKWFRGTSNAIAMLPEQVLKKRHRGRLRLRNERTEEVRMLQGFAEANQVDLYLPHMTCMKMRLDDADPEPCAKLGR